MNHTTPITAKLQKGKAVKTSKKQAKLPAKFAPLLAMAMPMIMDKVSGKGE
jgi:hypothetical protein